MKKYQGTPVSGGIAMGRICVLEEKKHRILKQQNRDPKEETARWENARQTAKKQLEALYENAEREVGKEDAAIFKMHGIMLEDEEYRQEVENTIRTERVNAEYAVEQAGEKFAAMLFAMEDDYMKGRAADVKDITQRLLTVLEEGANADYATGHTTGKSADYMIRESIDPTAESAADAMADQKVIIAATDLMPSQTMQLDRKKVLAFVTLQGSAASHTAILAKNLGIPALTGMQMDPEAFRELDGHMAAVDAQEGCLIVDPIKEILPVLEEKEQKREKERKALQEWKGRESVTRDGRKIPLYANIGSVEELSLALENDAEGIGLFRSEFLYLDRESCPDEEEQFTIYRKVLEAMQGKEVIIRTLDIGADKQAPCLRLPKEENPALGLRAIRVCFQNPPIFKTQLRALFRASAFGRLSIMYPMITSVEELEKILKITEEIKEELKKEEIPFDEVRQGIMIETPAAVMISKELARLADFFSIGTNDLTQYTLAVDRMNPALGDFYNPRHKAILRMIAQTAQAAHQAGIPCGICGELGSDPELTSFFAEIGIDELSVSPGSILPLRRALSQISAR